MEKLKFFTHYDRPVCDCEHYEEGTSLTVPDQVEPVQVTVRRCMRGELIQDVKDVYYENDNVKDIDEALNNVDETLSPGFDLADVPDLMASTQVDKTDSSVAEPKEVAPAGSTSTTDSTSETQSNDVSDVK